MHNNNKQLASNKQPNDKYIIHGAGGGGLPGSDKQRTTTAVIQGGERGRTEVDCLR
jgi:hypothetical protein